MGLVEATSELFDSESRAFPVRLWDGTVLPPGRGDVKGCVVLTVPGAV